MLRILAVGLALALLLSPVSATSPELKSRISVLDIQDFVESIFDVPEARSQFQDGDTIVVAVANDRWYGTLITGAITMVEGNLDGATHIITVDRNAMFSIINAYDESNTAKLAVKAKYMTASSQRAAVNTAIGALARTPLDERLPSYTPKEGDSVTFQGCTGALGPKNDGQFEVTWCDDRYTVNAIGGVNGKLPRQHLTQSPLINVKFTVSLASLGADSEYANSIKEQLKSDLAKATGIDASRFVVQLVREG
jgi:hypothetical protein